MGWIYIGELLLLAALWGASFLFMREGAPQFGPIPLMMLRTAIAALFLLPCLLWLRQQRAVVQHWRPILIVGLTNTAIPFCLFAYTSLFLGAGFTSILNATAPMFAALIALVWLGQRLSKAAIAGLLIGFSGVFVLLTARQGPEQSVQIVPMLCALGAASLYGFAANYSKSRLQGVPSMAIASGSQIFSALVLAPLAWWSWPIVPPDNNAWIQVLILGVACTGIAYIMYFHLLDQVGVGKAITVAYLVPVFGVLWGVLFLQESVTVVMLIGAAFILFGVGLATGMLKLKKLTGSRRSSYPD